MNTQTINNIGGINNELVEKFFNKTKKFDIVNIMFVRKNADYTKDETILTFNNYLNFSNTRLIESYIHVNQYYFAHIISLKINKKFKLEELVRELKVMAKDFKINVFIALEYNNEIYKTIDIT